MLVYVQVLCGLLADRVRAARESDSGASAVEWAIIAAISVVIATVVGVFVYDFVNTKGSDLNKCATVQAGTKC